MFGHARVLPPDQRSLSDARIVARLLLTKAARRVRRGGYYCGSLMLWLRGCDRSWGDMMTLPQVNDDQAVLSALGTLCFTITLPRNAISLTARHSQNVAPPQWRSGGCLLTGRQLVSRVLPSGVRFAED